MTAQSRVQEAVQTYGKDRESLLTILQYVCDKDRWLSEEAMMAIAAELDMSAAEVYGVASFYSFLATEPQGRFVIRLCKTISCDMNGKQKIMKAIQDKLRIKVGETTPDRMFTLLETNCMGWCHEGPVMLINDEVYTELTPEKAVRLIDEYQYLFKESGVNNE